MSAMPTDRIRSTGKTALQDLLFAGLVLLFVLLSFFASRQESVTIDEFRHLSTGVHVWQSRDYSFDPATPPLWKMAMALPAYLDGAPIVQFRQFPEIAAGWEPWLVATDFMRDSGTAYNSYLQSARLVNIMAASLCLVLLYRRCRKSFGPGAALFATAFLALSPTFLAHSHYATTDVIATLTVMVTIFLLIDFLDKPGLVRLTGLSLAFAVALLCKYSALLLVLLLLLAPFILFLKRQGQRSVPILILGLTIVVIMPLLAINGFYEFRGIGAPLMALHLESRGLTSLARTPVGTLPLPLPRAFVEGFDKQKADSDYSEFPAYLMGKWSADGFRSYYLAAFCLKESLPFLLTLAAALILMMRHKWGGFCLSELLILLYVPVTLFLVLSCMNRLNVGVRYLLPAYPFFCLFIAGLYRNWGDRNGARLVLLLLFMLHSVSVFRISPHFTSYFNELVGGAENGYRYLIDSNIDWGQDLPGLKKIMIEQGIAKVQLAYFGHGLPEFYGIEYEPLSLPAKPGYVAISISLLQGHPYLLTYLNSPQIAEADQFAALRNLRPVGRAGYSMMIYRVK